MSTASNHRINFKGLGEAFGKISDLIKFIINKRYRELSLQRNEIDNVCAIVDLKEKLSDIAAENIPEKNYINIEIFLTKKLKN